MDTSSASGLEWITQPWRLESATIGPDDNGPRNTKCTPNVLRWDPRSPAKSASTKRCRLTCS
eukprot:7546643-Lingulodinium_polyedra.AAC.1